MTKVNDELNRFVNAQQVVYAQALQEITKGKKQSHWMWYIFPQMIGLGTSSTAKQYGIKNIEEARAFLEHSTLGPRLIEISKALLSLDESNPHIIFGYPDNLKLQSSMTLFSVIDESKLFLKILDKYYSGNQCMNTLKILGKL